MKFKRQLLIKNNKRFQMDVKPCHKALQQMLMKIFKEFFISGVQPGYQQTLKCNDTDNVKYRIHGINDKVSLYLICIDVDVIWNYVQNYFVKTYYPQFTVKLSQFKNQKAIQIIIDNNLLTKLTETFKDLSDSGTLTGKKKLDAIFTKVSKRLACVKRHFFSSPFEIMLIAAKNNAENKPAQNVSNICFYTKPDRKQKIWLAFEKNQFTVYYGISFEDKFQQQLAKIYFSQLVDAKKHVHHAPAVAVYESQLSEFLVRSFPQEKKETYTFTNGIVSMTLFGNLVKNVHNMGSFLSGFRNYAYYHIQASKCYLHSRVLRRINNFQKDLNLSKIKEDDSNKFSLQK